MVIRGLVGLILCVLGGVWFAQGIGVMKGSMMSGHSQYAVLGVIALLIGILFLVWSWRVRGRRDSS